MLSPVSPTAASPTAASPTATAVSDRYSAPLSVTFLIRAPAEPGVMPRVIELFAKRGLVPQRWNSAVSGAGSDVGLGIDVQMTGLERDEADYIARCMRQIHGVETVFTIAGHAPSPDNPWAHCDALR